MKKPIKSADLGSYLNKNKIRKLLFGSKDSKGFVPTFFLYLILLSFGYIYFLPVLRMVVTTFMDPGDQVDPRVIWIPSRLVFDNIRVAFNSLRYVDGFYVSFMLSVVPALLQTASTAMTGYALARFNFPLKRFWIVMVLVFYVVPGQLLTVPRYLMFLEYNFINKLTSIYLPAVLGQGLKSGIFVLIFYQFFHSYPKSIDEAAEVDGAGRLRIFSKIALPMAGPALVISIIFSVVWYWNETSQMILFFGNSMADKLLFVPITTMRTLPTRLLNFRNMMIELFAAEGATESLTDAYSLAGALLVILPMLILYLVMQRQFIESIERSGITGE